MRNTFVLYTDRLNVLEYLSDEQAGVLLKAIYAKVTDADLPEMDGMTRVAFCGIEAHLVEDARKYEETCEKRREGGKLGGRPKNQTKPKGYLENLQKPKGYFENQKNPDTDTDTDTDIKEKESKKKLSARFVPPSLQEVKGYCLERKNKVDPEGFIDFYTSKNWMVGKTKMKDWKAAVRTWERRDRGSPEKNKFNRFEHNDYDFEELERALLNG